MFKLEKMKYRYKIALIIFIFTLLPLGILGSFLIKKEWDGKVEDILNRNKSQLSFSVNSIDNLFSSNADKILYINNNYYINNFLEYDSDLNLVGIMTFNDYLQSVMLAINSDNHGAEIYIYSLNDTTYNGDYIRGVEGLASANKNDWENVKDGILKYNDDEIIWMFRTLKGKQYKDGAKDYICIYKKMVTMLKPLAIIEIRIPFNKIMEYFDYNIPKGSYIICSMDNGKKRYTIKTGDTDMESMPQLTEPNLIEGTNRDYYIINLDLKYSIGRMSMYIPRNVIFMELKIFLITIVGTFLAIMILLFFTVEIVAFFLTKRLNSLFIKMNTNVELLIKNESQETHAVEDEFGTMENRFNELIQKVKVHYEERNEYELERKSLETKLLQERFNPHFLYNTLSTLKWISEEEKVQVVIDSMVKYYRIALNKGSSIVTIYQELEMIREYLKLQKFAYGNEFEFSINIEDGLDKYLVLKHLLQPVVENAVLHGLSGRETGGQINIKVKDYEGDIVFEISDNGIGMEPAKIEKILNSTTIDAYGGYGMINIQKRIEVFYGEKYGIKIESILNKGTTVKITVPRHLNSDVPISMK